MDAPLFGFVWSQIIMIWQFKSFELLKPFIKIAAFHWTIQKVMNSNGNNFQKHNKVLSALTLIFEHPFLYFTEILNFSFTPKY